MDLWAPPHTHTHTSPSPQPCPLTQNATEVAESLYEHTAGSNWDCSDIDYTVTLHWVMAMLGN